MRYRAILLMFALFAVLPAYAQEEAQEQEKSHELPPVVVEKSKINSALEPGRVLTEEQAQDELELTPGGVGFIGSEDITESRAGNLKDVLDFVPGVFIRPRFGAADESQLSIRGSGLRNNFHLRGVNVLIDGFSYGSADGFSDFESLELLTTKRIEVYKGANALRFGGNTLGGAINLVTKTGRDAAPLELRSEGGSFGFLKNYIGTGQAYGPFDIYAGFADTKVMNSFRDHAEQVRRRFYSNVGYELPDGTTLRFDLGYTRNEEQLPGSLTREEFERNPKQANPSSELFDEERNYDFYRAAFTVHVPFKETQAFEFATQFNYQDLDHPLSFAVIDQNTYNFSLEPRYVVTAPLFGHDNRFTVGFQFAYTFQEDRNLENNTGERGALVKDQDNTATNIGVYAEEQFDITPQLTLIAGGRVQYAHRSVEDSFLSDGDSSDAVDFFSATPKVGVIWKAAPSIQIYGNVSSSHEPPLLLELTAPGQIGGDLSELDAQKAVQFEIGTRGDLWERVAWDISLYNIELWDEIQNVNVQPFPDAPFTIPRYQNIDRSRHSGIEVGIDVILLKGLLKGMGLGSSPDKLAVHTAYTYSRFVFVDDDNFGNNDIPGAPEHYIRAEVRYDSPWGIWIAPNIESIPKGYFVNSDNTEKTDDYILLNVQAGYNYKPWNLGAFLEARNVFDKDYVSSVSVDSGNDRFFEPGDERSFYVGLEWKWD